MQREGEERLLLQLGRWRQLSSTGCQGEALVLQQRAGEGEKEKNEPAWMLLPCAGDAPSGFS